MPKTLQELRYTTAPVDYDGFGTTDHGVVGETCGKPVRLVGISPEHLNWQEMRYGSGLHPSHARESWDDLVVRGLAKWKQLHWKTTLRNARRVLKDVGVANAWKMPVTDLAFEALRHVRCADSYGLSQDEIETLRTVVTRHNLESWPKDSPLLNR